MGNGQTIINSRLFIRKPEHPNSDTKGYVRNSHLVVEEKIGRFIEIGEVVHHKNGDTMDDRIENLELLEKREHDRITVLVSEKCMHNGCNKKHCARGLCSSHYNKYKRQGKKMPLEPTRKNRWVKHEMNRTCLIESCQGAYRAKGLCVYHYNKFLLLGKKMPINSFLEYETANQPGAEE